MLPCSSLSFAGTSAAVLEWAHNPTAAAPSGSAAAPAGQNPGDRPCQGFPPESSSHGSNSIRTFYFLKEAIIQPQLFMLGANANQEYGGYNLYFEDRKIGGTPRHVSTRNNLATWDSPWLGLDTHSSQNNVPSNLEPEPVFNSITALNNGTNLLSLAGPLIRLLFYPNPSWNTTREL